MLRPSFLPQRHFLEEKRSLREATPKAAAFCPPLLARGSTSPVVAGFRFDKGEKTLVLLSPCP